MIRSRRQLHRHLFLGLAVVLPSMLAVTLLGRPVVPPVATLDDDLGRLAGFPAPGEDRSRLIDTGTYRYEVEDRDLGPTGVGLIIKPQSVILKPDLLVYWTPGSAEAAEPGDDAVLVGSLSGTSRRMLSLPPAASTGRGTLVVYSLAHQEAVDRFPLGLALSRDEGGQ